MEWIKVQANMWSNPKIMALSPSAGWALVRVWCYCGDHETDGHLPACAARLVGLGKRQAKELEAAEFLEACADGWAVHDWEDYQEPADAAERRRQLTRARVWRYRQRQLRDAMGGRGDA